METTNLILEFTKVLVWPTVAVSFTLVFHREVRAALTRLKEAKLPGGVSLSFESELSQAKKISEKVEPTPLFERATQADQELIPQGDANLKLLKLGLSLSPSGLDIDYYRQLALRDPNLALAGLRIELEIAARNLAKGFHIPVDPKDPVTLLYSRLQSAGAVTAEQAELIRRIIRLCNLAVHGEPISLQQASEVISLARSGLDDYAAWLRWGFEPSDSDNAGVASEQ